MLWGGGVLEIVVMWWQEGGGSRPVGCCPLSRRLVWTLPLLLELPRLCPLSRQTICGAVPGHDDRPFVILCSLA